MKDTNLMQNYSLSQTQQGLQCERFYSKAKSSPYEQVEWERRTASISNERGEILFEQKEIEVPCHWSLQASNVVASKYFHGALGTPEREFSVKQLIGRVVTTLRTWGLSQGYFANDQAAEVFQDELTLILLQQKAAFNSPVWFNLGVVETAPQCSACFINSVEDSLESILNLTKTEGLLFKWGSGTGTNLSRLRSSYESLSGGGTASGPVSFMRGFDAFAGAIKSGGKTRRAAKMVILNVDHPDIREFVQCKAKEEKKAWALIEAGYDGGFNVPGGAYDSVQFQNANHSVRISDDFMRAVEADGNWQTRAVTTGEVIDTFKARELMREIAESTWICGDPGLQFDTTIQRWHTVKNSGRIQASNPCSEFMFLDDTACNLASINLLNFLDESGKFQVAAFRHTVRLILIAQDILIDKAGYPTLKIAENSRRYRPLGLGYANLGALLMALGLPYDSDTGRSLAAIVTALMTGEAYRVSAELAQTKGAFEAFEANRDCMLEVIQAHLQALQTVQPYTALQEQLKMEAENSWQAALSLGKSVGFRNAQVTALAPTGTIGFMMDCDTTGIEPDFSLIKYKRLVGGGMLKIINQTIPQALARLGYDTSQRKEILDYLNREETLEGAPGLREQDLPVFDCAFPSLRGTRAIHYMGHLRMMAAVQPFISGAISKTVNLPTQASVDDIFEVYMQAWKLGLKAVAVYRDGSKRTQPLSTHQTSVQAKPALPQRRHLPAERQAITHKFSIGGHEGYLTVGMYADGSPGEIFITMAKEGSVISGLMDSFATIVSLALQYGVPLSVMVDKLSHTRFEPSGYTGNKELPFAKSIMDYIFRWLALKFLTSHGDTPQTAAGSEALKIQDIEGAKPENRGLPFVHSEDAPPCYQCGSGLMVRNGSCYKCLNCGSSSGCS